MKNLLKHLERYSKSLFIGIVFVIVLFAIVFFTDSGDSMLPLLERHPFAWVLFWPMPLLNRAFGIEDPLWETLALNVIIYSLIIYIVLSRRAKQRHLP